MQNHSIEYVSKKYESDRNSNFQVLCLMKTKVNLIDKMALAVKHKNPIVQCHAEGISWQARQAGFPANLCYLTCHSYLHLKARKVNYHYVQLLRDEDV